MLRVVLLRASLFFAVTGGSITCFAQSPAAADESRGSAAAFGALIQSIAPYRPAHQNVVGPIKVFGSSSMDALAHGWAGSFSQFHDKAQLNIHGSNSEQAFAQLVKSPSAVAMLSRPVTDAELEQLKSKGLKQPVAFPVAREALAVYVHTSNPTQSISGAQLNSVFTKTQDGGALNWQLLSAAGEFGQQPIHVLARTANCGTQRFLKDFVFGSAEMREGVSEHVSNAKVLEALGSDQLGIAICGLRAKGENTKMLHLTAGDRIVPSDDAAVLNGSYPLTRPLTLVIDLGRSDAEAIGSQELVRFALGRSGQLQSIRSGFFPVEPQLMRSGIAKLGDAKFH